MKKIKSPKKLKKFIRQKEYERDAENRVVINMSVKDDENFLSPYSDVGTPVISADVAEFLEESTRSLLPKEQLTLRIYSDCIDGDEKVIYKKAVKQYYSERFIANERELNRNKIIALILGALGVIILATALFLEPRIDNAIWAEVMDIAAWVFLWESVDISFLESKKLNYNKKRYLSFTNMNIEYFPMKDINRVEKQLTT